MDKVQKCSSGGDPGFRWGQSGDCHTYDRNSEIDQQSAWLKAAADGLAENKGRKKEDVLRNSKKDKDDD